MAGYYGYSKSNNAVQAEIQGRYPLSKGAPLLSKIAGITQKAAKAFLKKEGTREYHHTSKFYNVTDYYDVLSALEHLANAGNEKAAEYLKLNKMKCVISKSDYLAHRRAFYRIKLNGLTYYEAHMMALKDYNSGVAVTDKKPPR